MIRVNVGTGQSDIEIGPSTPEDFMEEGEEWISKNIG